MDIQKDDRILVTGGAGFIGSHLVRRLAEIDSEIRVLDNFDDFYPGKEGNLQRYRERKNVELIQGNILEVDSLADLCGWATLVFHEAAQAGIRYCNKYPIKAHRVNVEGTLNVLTACRKADPGPRRIVNVSSSSIYGNITKLPIGEDDPKRPQSPYAATKLAAEHYCTAYNDTYGVDVVSLRYFSVYGPSQRPDLVISTFTKKLANGNRPTIYGRGDHSRDFTYVTDIVEGTIQAAQADESIGGRVYNLGKGERTGVKQLFEMLVELLDAGEIEPIYEPEFPGEFPHTQADISRARKDLGYEPRVSLEEGLRMYVDWYLNSGDGRR